MMTMVITSLNTITMLQLAAIERRRFQFHLVFLKAALYKRIFLPILHKALSRRDAGAHSSRASQALW